MALAAALPELPYACGLATVELMAGDVCTPSLVPAGGAIEVAAAAADEGLLERWAAPADRQQWWRDRVRRCSALLPPLTARSARERAEVVGVAEELDALAG